MSARRSKTFELSGQSKEPSVQHRSVRPVGRGPKEKAHEFIAATRQKEEATWPFKYNHELDFNSNRLAVAIEKANERVMAAVAAQPWLKGMGTTVVAGLLNEKILSLAHVGDSRAYLLRDGQLSCLTDDHSWVHEQVAAGILTEEEAKSHPLKNVVTRALGGGPSVSPDLQELVFSASDLYIFCSDGLTTMLGDDEIRDLALAEKDPRKLCEKLIDLANEKGGVDNITVVIVAISADHVAAITGQLPSKAKFDKASKTERPDKTERIDRTDKLDQAEVAGKAAAPAPAPTTDAAGKVDVSDKTEPAARIETAGAADTAGKADMADKTEKLVKPE